MKFKIFFLASYLIATGLVFFIATEQPVEAKIAGKAEAEKRAKAYCKTRFEKRTELAACAKGYEAAIQAKQADKSVICDNLSDGLELKPGACKDGFDQGMREFKKDNPKKPANFEAELKANKFCQSENYNNKVEDFNFLKPFDQSIFNTCTKGYVEALTSNAVDYGFYCENEKALGAERDKKDSCVAGFKQGLREYQDYNGVKNPATPGNNNQQGTDPNEDAGSGGNQLGSCDATWSSPLSWIICPIIKLGAGLSDTVFHDIVSPLLSDVPVTYKSGDPIYSVWQGFRLIANLLLVGSILLIVYAQTRGGDK